jgi:hypothetical protein
MMESDDRQAGAVILKDLALFNKAAIYMETEIDPLVRQEVSAAVAEWLEAHSWKGEADASESFDELWVAPPQWVGESDTSCIASFCLSRRSGSDSNSYEIADLFGVGETSYGFRFEVDYGSFGGRSGWNAYAKTLSDLAQKLGELGWSHEGKGVFFRPVGLPSDQLESAWTNEDWSEATAPIGQALDALEAALPIFGAIIDGAKRKSE